MDLRPDSVFDESLFEMRLFIKEADFTYPFLVGYLLLSFFWCCMRYHLEPPPKNCIMVITLNLLLSYKKLTELRAHIFYASMPLKVEGVLPLSPDTTLIVLIFSRITVESDLLN